MAQDRSKSCSRASNRGKVCSHAVTVKQLRSWGIDSELVLPHYKEPGIKAHTAVHMAWQAGKVMICTLDPREDPWTRMTSQSDESRKEVLEWIRTHRASVIHSGVK